MCRNIRHDICRVNFLHLNKDESSKSKLIFLCLMPDSGRAAWNFSSALRLLVGQTFDFASNWSRSNRFHVGSQSSATGSQVTERLLARPWASCSGLHALQGLASVDERQGALLAMDHAPPRQPGCTAERPGASASLLFCRSCAPPR